MTNCRPFGAGTLGEDAVETYDSIADFNMAILRLLGLEGKPVRDVTLRIAPDAFPTADVTLEVWEADTDALTYITENYEVILEPIKKS